MLREKSMGMAVIMSGGMFRVELTGLVLASLMAYHGYLFKAPRFTIMKHIFSLCVLYCVYSNQHTRR